MKRLGYSEATILPQDQVVRESFGDHPSDECPVSGDHG